MPLTADCKTISAGPDTGYLACATGFFGNPPVNNTNIQVATNLLGCFGAANRSAMVIGHGNVGFIKSGNGNQGGSDDQYIAYDNRPKWLQYLLQLKNKCTSLTLLGCNVGANDSGADLLFYVSTAVNCPVMAPTFEVWCGGGNVYLDPKAQWQTARPGFRPTPIPLPTFMIHNITDLTLGSRSNPTKIPLSAVKELSLTKINLRGESKSKLFENEAAQGVAQLAFDNPFTTSAKPAAIITGEITLKISHGGNSHTYRFVIYNNYLIQEVEEPNSYYRAGTAFSQALAELL